MKNRTLISNSFYLIGVIGIAVSLSGLGQSFAAEHDKKPKPTPSPHGSPSPTAGHTASKTNESPTDLSETMSRMKLREGNNIVSTANGIKLGAIVKNGQVVGYGATDSSGNKLRTTTERTSGGGGGKCPCLVCVYYPGTKNPKNYCYCTASCPTRKAQ